MGTAIPRDQRPERQQKGLDERSLAQTLTPDHIARVVWDFGVGLDPSGVRVQVKPVHGRPGQARLSLALWLLATLEGIGNARELNWLCHYHAA